MIIYANVLYLQPFLTYTKAKSRSGFAGSRCTNPPFLDCASSARNSSFLSRILWRAKNFSSRRLRLLFMHTDAKTFFFSPIHWLDCLSVLSFPLISPFPLSSVLRCRSISLWLTVRRERAFFFDCCSRDTFVFLSRDTLTKCWSLSTPTWTWASPPPSWTGPRRGGERGSSTTF